MVHYDFKGKVALITGGASGIGLATARAFIAAGADVAIAGRDEAKGMRAAEALGRALFVRCDVREEADVARLIDTVMKRYGRLDAAFNCAGVGGDMQPLEHASQAVWDDVMAINARGVWLAMRYEIPALLASGGGAIVNMSSMYGAAGRAAHHAYVASKHAVLGMTRSVALEYATRNVRVNALCAGATATEGMQQAARVVPDVVQALIAQHPMSRLASEDEIASAALFLCSDAAGYVTGTPLAVDGGFLAA